jgi:hypothetical protein
VFGVLAGALGPSIVGENDQQKRPSSAYQGELRVAHRRGPRRWTAPSAPQEPCEKFHEHLLRPTRVSSHFGRVHSP